MEAFSIIGQNVEKKDGIPKVTGQAVFAADMRIDGMLHAKVLRSRVAHATLNAIDVTEALKLPGVAAVLTGKDIPGSNRIGIILKDEPVLVDDKIRRIGDALAVVAAQTPEIAEQALSLIRVDYTPLPVLTSVRDAMREEHVFVHGTTNILNSRKLIKGDVDAAFPLCDVIVEKDYHTNYFAHMFIEPEAGVSNYENGILTVWASTQNPHFDRGEVARMLGLPQSKVRVVQAATGGGFGGKLDISTQCLLGLLTYHTKKPVKLVYSREESMEVSSKRHPHWMTFRTGADKNGKLLAMEAELLEDSGAYASYAPAVITRAMVHATGPYEIPNVRVIANMVYTNNPMAGAFRGFGVPQVAVAHEQQMDILAERLGLSPIEIRKINALKKGSYTSTMQKLESGVGFTQTLEKAEQKAAEVIKNSVPCRLPTIKRGVGVGCMWYGIGNTGLPNPSSAFVEMHADCSVTVLSGCADIGQGSNTALCQIVAETLGVPYQDVNIVSADTGKTPDAGATSASRQTYISGNACKKAAEMAQQTLTGIARDLLNAPNAPIGYRNGTAYIIGDEQAAISLQDVMNACKARGVMVVGSGYHNPDVSLLHPDHMQGTPYGAYAFATHIVEVEVNTETGVVKVLKDVAVHDVGQAINRKAVEGQIEGGSLMGMGLGILENLEVKDARIQNRNFSNYLIFTAKDMPEIYPVIVECHDASGPFGAKGVGEPALVPVAPAILNAVYNATGVRFTSVPLTLESVVERLNDKKSEVAI